jgi:PAS domain-containing protein
VDVNPAAAKMIGAAPEQIIGRVCHQFICPAEQGKCPITDLHQQVDNSERVLLKANDANPGQPVSKVPILKMVTSIEIRGRRYLLENFFDYTDYKKAQEEPKNKMFELAKLNSFMVGRELRIAELKKEIEELKAKAGQT